MTTEDGTVVARPSGEQAGGRTPRARDAAAAAPRRPTGSSPRRPVHLAVMAGTAAGLYAVSLAGVTALQASTNEALAAERDPIAAAIAEQRTHHDRLEATMDGAAAAYGEAAAAYTAILATLEAHETDLAALATAVKKAEGTASNLAVPARAALPRIVSTVTARSAPRPATNATTGASGGG